MTMAQSQVKQEKKVDYADFLPFLGARPGTSGSASGTEGCTVSTFEIFGFLKLHDSPSVSLTLGYSNGIELTTCPWLDQTEFGQCLPSWQLGKRPWGCLDRTLYWCRLPSKNSLRVRLQAYVEEIKEDLHYKWTDCCRRRNQQWTRWRRSRDLPGTNFEWTASSSQVEYNK